MYPSILFEDNYLVVIEKGAGMVVNRAGTVAKETLQDWVESNIKFDSRDSPRHEESDFVKRSGIVHRIDKDTSGIVLCAKREDAFLALQNQFKERSVAKEYTLLVHGHLSPDRGEINAPIARLPWNRMRFGVVPQGRDAVTEYEVVENKKVKVGEKEEKGSLVKAFPATGRTHQLRVHFKHINHPIFGDRLYAGRKQGRRDAELLDRQFLHASKISFTHPGSGESLTFDSPLPPDLVAIPLKLQ